MWNIYIWTIYITKIIYIYILSEQFCGLRYSIYIRLLSVYILYYSTTLALFFITLFRRQCSFLLSLGMVVQNGILKVKHSEM